MSENESSGQESDGELFECPTCDRSFDTDRGVKVHHKRTHGESIAGVEVECGNCGKAITRTLSQTEYYDSHYCETCQDLDLRDRVTVDCAYCGDDVTRSRWHVEKYDRIFCPDNDCYGNWMSENNRGENHPRWQDDVPRTVPCSYCGATLERRPERILDRSEEFFCGAGEGTCEQKWKQENTPTGKEHPSYTKKGVSCTWCGDPIIRKAYYLELVENVFCPNSSCYNEWLSENIRGEENPNWRGGGGLGYGPGWNEAKKEQVRERDNRECQQCGRPEQTHVELFGIKHPVHHIMRPDDVNHPPTHNNPDNLVTLCVDGCHQKWQKFSPLRPDTTK